MEVNAEVGSSLLIPSLDLNKVKSVTVLILFPIPDGFMDIYRCVNILQVINWIVECHLAFLLYKVF